jgi:methylaspartate ammonia-lyase
MAAKASTNGQFTAELAVKADRCTAIAVQAFGDRGSRAMVDITTPDCASIDRIDP